MMRGWEKLGKLNVMKGKGKENNTKKIYAKKNRKNQKEGTKECLNNR